MRAFPCNRCPNCKQKCPYEFVRGAFCTKGRRASVIYPNKSAVLYS